MEHFIKPWLPSPTEPSYTFINASVVDVVSGTVHSGSTVRTRGGKIESITTAVGSPVLEDGVIVVDLDGKYLTPGLIDSHVHISGTPGESDIGKMLKPEEIMTAFRIPYVCRDMLSRGFTTVRDCGGAPAALKSAIEEWLVPGPRLLRAGHALTQNGGHGDFREAHESQDPECPSCGHFVGLARIVDGVAEAIHKTRDELRQGSDFIKVMGSGGMLTKRTTMEHTQFNPEEMCAITTTAAAGGTYTTVHAYSPESIQQAVNNGASGIEHGNFLDRDTAKLMAEKKVYLTPTLVTFAISADGPGSDMFPTEKREVYRRSLKAGLEAIKVAAEEGVEICFGTDLLGPVGIFQSREFALRAQVQTPLDVLRSATVTPAKMMGLKDVGQIKEGFVADLLVLESNPLDDISLLGQPEKEVLGVMKEGRLCFSRLEGVKALLN
ncbi:hypothetical protein LTR56_008359 [Elasticomyces elasticus]|nr:hypothetical protein LTR56_008359 [Elasticomyces elasticus]KAK3661495.1 hypothetical protein LTR22_007505 [Elasticomyces elasticus]KAK4926147.1 hypothetical protein LTR49_006851 [Elasticomyces elasticus]KAK5756916.1 hypothetical protein LTS12_012995 [Elasticomyces elasticus]